MQPGWALCKTTWLLGLGLSLLLVILLGLGFWPPTEVSHAQGPTPTVDRLAIPVLPENPTQLDQGRLSYYNNCMACHGDLGQGLTDEWRVVYEDHQGCWDVGCHGGREKDEGFPIPQYVPAVVSAALIQHFAQPQALYDYLRQTHPPYAPGSYPAAEYWALTAYVLDLNGRLPVDRVLGDDLTPRPTLTPTQPKNPTSTPTFLRGPKIWNSDWIIVLAILALAVLIFLWFALRHVATHMAGQ